MQGLTLPKINIAMMSLLNHFLAIDKIIPQVFSSRRNKAEQIYIWLKIFDTSIGVFFDTEFDRVSMLSLTRVAQLINRVITHSMYTGFT